MKFLFGFLVIEFLCRLTYQSAVAAAGATAFNAPFMAVCYALGEWTSPTSAWKWLRSHPLILYLMVTATIFMIGLFIYNRFEISRIIAEAIAAYFVLHAFCAVGEFLMERMRSFKR
jgi:hypothetical protein